MNSSYGEVVLQYFPTVIIYLKYKSTMQSVIVNRVSIIFYGRFNFNFKSFTSDVMKYLTLSLVQN